MSRRAFLKTAAVFAGFAGAALLTEGLEEPRELEVKRVRIQLSRLPPVFAGFRLAQLSDFHYTEFMTDARLRHIVNTTNAQNPDLVVLTGDYVTAPAFGIGGRRRALKVRPCAEILRGLRTRYGVMAVLGNHDLNSNAGIITEALSAGGIAVLVNRSLPIESGGARFWIAGLDDALEGRPRPEVALRGLPREECVIAAVHEPDYARELQRYSVDLQLSGHSHGGQVCLPGIGPLYLPYMARRYPRGYYRLGALQLYTNRGVGCVNLPLRVLCPPELTVFELNSEGTD